MINTQKILTRTYPEDDRPEVRKTTGTRSIGGLSINIIDVVIASGPVIFLTTVFILENTYPHLNRVTNTISELVWKPNGWILTALFLLFGFILMSLALRICLISTRSRCLKIGAAIIFMIGLGFIMIAIFPTRAPGAGQTVKTLLHQQTANALSMAFPVSCFFVARGLKNERQWQVFRMISFTCGLSGLLMTVAGGIAVFGNMLWIGAIERAIVGTGLLWLECLGIFLTFPQIREYFNEHTGGETVSNRAEMTTTRIPVATRFEYFITGLKHNNK